MKILGAIALLVLFCLWAYLSARRQDKLRIAILQILQKQPNLSTVSIIGLLDRYSMVEVHRELRAMEMSGLIRMYPTEIYSVRGNRPRTMVELIHVDTHA